ncbi:MAG: hypothetical protein KDK36_21470, partial [Leptospiraceae bacterium]|nr:hypothetical protein [Leptospiraceae bacterium]
LYIYRENQKIKTKLNYLDPGFLKINQKNNSVLISSFETTDNKYLILTAIDFSGNEKWQFKLKDFFPDITIEVKYLNDFYLSEDQLFFIINDYLFRMDSNNGRLIKVVKI